MTGILTSNITTKSNNIGIEMTTTLNITKSVIYEPWFIGIAVAIGLIFIVLINVCLIIREKSGKYSTKEKQPLKNIPITPESQGFKEFHNNVNDIVPIQPTQQVQQVQQQSSVSPLALNYDEKFFHDEDDSMAEYGNGENVQFDEDGSFIGLYSKDRIQALNYNNFATSQPIFEKQIYN